MQMKRLRAYASSDKCLEKRNSLLMRQAGALASEMRSGHVGSSLNSGHSRDRLSRPKSAMSGSGFSSIGSLPGFETAMLMKRGVGVIEPFSSQR